ncbi:hypothetical protein Patl1_05009 [Pistacia atlantica]|uniref:Uncharacterized protein n=1 Tax=Pistacia atlantica TaxID=434234 RepID=A0ACC1BSG9_9ROSI|nr:hypothetical protein Patl1_05009 [Pistacia atlantica]
MDAVVSQPNSKARKILMGNGEGKGKDYIIELFLCDLFSLTNAYTNVTSLGHTESEIAQRATGLLHGIHIVKTLTLSTEILEVR